jgi:glycolate oxidase iron-sulfur subunit
VRVLARNGCEVVAPLEQACCGALHAHNGDQPAARELARRNIDTFLSAGVDAVIVNSAGCGAAMKEYGELLADDAEYAGKAHKLSGLVKDVSEFLVGLPFEVPMREVNEPVTYQDSCHLITEMAHADRCCGSAGVYSLTQAEMSLRLLRGKMRSVRATGATTVATSNPGCMAQLEAGSRRFGPPADVVHVVELLDRSYSAK